jgi:peptidoglycan hydrolase-like protein with peptidoglycan-binding domain
MLTFNLPQSSATPTFKLPTIRQGSSGSSVRVLQQLLNFKDLCLRVDGDFGSRTEEAVKEFQRIHNLPVDGIVDAQTWHHLSSGLLPFEC